MYQNAKLAWIVAGIFAFLTVMLLAYVITDYNERENNLGATIEEGAESIEAQREAMRESCEADPSSGACREALDRMSDLLDEVSDDFARFGASAETGATP